MGAGARGHVARHDGQADDGQGAVLTPFGSVVVTGASSGIGAALARHYARPGVKLGLLGRDPARLGTVVAAARAAGAAAHPGLFDLRDRTALLGYLTAFEAKHPVDLLIVNAGVLEGRHADGTIETADAARRVIEINLLTALDTVHAVLPGMRRRRRGHIAMVSSLAAIAPVPDAPAYSASKAGLLAYGRALREAVRPDGVRVSVACPGYVTSAMTDRHIGHQPHKISAARAAERIAAGIARNKAVIGFPQPLYGLALIASFVPEAITRAASKGLRFHVGPR